MRINLYYRFLKISQIAICGIVFILTACSNESNSDHKESDSNNIVIVQSDNNIVNIELLHELTKQFYLKYPDDYDMLVFWGSSEFAPGYSFYFPIKNDNIGIGYKNIGTELFDNSNEFSSSRLQGIIWMGPDWRVKSEMRGVNSVLGVLAQETAHRWGCTIYFKDSSSSNDNISEELLGSPFHWSFFLNTGASPLGGNKWEDMGNSVFRAIPVDYVGFSQLDLYLMGLISAEEVSPVSLLTNVRDINNLSVYKFSPYFKRVTQPVTVYADVIEISIDQIIEVEGIRNPDQGFNAKNIRQAWIYIHKKDSDLLQSDIDKLEQYRSEWGRFFLDATGGRASITTELYR